MSLIERAIAKLDNGPPPAALKAPPSVDVPASEAKSEAKVGAVFENGAVRGLADSQRVAKPESVEPNKTNGSAVVEKAGDAAAAKTADTALTKRKRFKLKLRAVGAQDYAREGPNRSELLGTFRHIKRPLLASIYGHGVPVAKNGRRIMVTSALPGEGKTFTSIHLALSIAAEVDTSVILVDGDIIRPSMHTVLGIGQQRGIADWFEDKTLPLTKLVSSTNVDGLKIVTAGQWKPNSAEALASRSMAEFFDVLSAEHPDAILVVDSPPLLPASESATLAKSMGQVVLVVGAGATSQSQVDQALEMLEGEQLVSLVLNRSRNSSSYANYGY